jgi:hypothetical protein
MHGVQGRPTDHAHGHETDQMLNDELEFAPEVDGMTMDTPAPVRAGPDGLYPAPQPGMLRDREC